MKRARLLAVIFTVGLALLPILFLIVYSFAESWFWPSLVPGRWSARAWTYVLSDDSGVFDAAVSSLTIASAVTMLALLIAIPAARAVAWHDFPGKRVLLILLLLPVLAPPLAAAMGVHAAFLRNGLVDTTTGVVLAHLIPAVPYAILILSGSFSRFDPDLEAQARTLGASRVAVWRFVTLPAVAPGMAVAGGFAFLISWSQYQLTTLVGGGRVLTLPVALISFQRGGNAAITAALSLIFLFPALAVFIAVSRFLRYET